MKLLTVCFAFFSTREILKSIKRIKIESACGTSFFSCHIDFWQCITSHMIAQKRLVHARSDDSSLLRNVCVCLQRACVRCYGRCARKRNPINTLGRFGFHVQGGAVGHAIHICSPTLIRGCTKNTGSHATGCLSLTCGLNCSCMERERGHICVRANDKSVMFTGSNSL